MSLDQDRAIQRSIPTAWEAFFARFGRLTDVQRQAIPQIADGHDVLITSGTASGKTEAVCAPLVERHLGPGRRNCVLYVSPTRALINDLYRRIQPAAEICSLRLMRRTGEYKDPLQNSPHILLTTPESLDSLLCRGMAANVEIHPLARVSAIVLDEIHLLYGTPRGEQVKWLLQRLRRLRSFGLRQGWIASDELQVVMLSATVADSDGLISDFCPGAVTVRGTKAREIITVGAPTAPLLESLPEHLAIAPDDRKILVFCNSRKKVEEVTAALAGSLAPLGFQVAAHHGSLSKEVREESEETLRTGNRVVLVSTSTLEIGIDVGDVDLVVLADPPPDVPAVLQRIGRGNRRSGHTRIMQCSETPRDAVIHRALLTAAVDGWLGDQRPGPQYAVALQQVVSFIYQSGSRHRSRRAVIELCGAALPGGFGSEILTSMVAAGDLIEDDRGIRLSDKLVDSCDKGEIHSNIEDAGGARVIDHTTGKGLAKGVVHHGGSSIGVAGRNYRLEKASGFQLEVSRTHAPGNGKWGYAFQPFFVGAGQAEAVARMIGADRGSWPLIWDGDRAVIYHFGGARRQAVLELLLEVEPSSAIERIDPWRIWGTDPRRIQGWMEAATTARLEFAISDQVERLERKLVRPRANSRLPFSVRLSEVRSWLHLDQEADAVRNARVVEATHTQSRLLHSLLQSVSEKADV